MGETERIKRLVAYYKRAFGTSDPFKIAEQLGVLYQIGKAKYDGCYMFLKNHRYIFLSDELDGVDLRLVMGHELGHAVLDRKQNCYFIKNKTLLLNSRFERRANLFVAHLLIDDSILQDFSEYTKEQFCEYTGYPPELLDLRLKETGDMYGNFY